MKKGFTLIELLAVIVILAIIALIATPIILGIIDDARKGSIEASANGYIDAVEYKIASSEIKGEETSSGVYDVANLDVDLDGSKPSSGTVTIEKGKITEANLCIDGYTVEYKNNKPKVLGACSYREKILNGADPVLKDELVPVVIASDGKVTKADTTKEWYNYSNKEWANAVILTGEDNYKVNETIPETDIESYFVWIPRYKYELFAPENYNTIIDSKPTESLAKTINIVFESKGTSISDGKDNWLTHPAFTAFDTNGLWVGKFEVTGTIDNLTVKPNLTSLRNQTLKTMFETAYNYKRENDSHMMKNTEWGAVAYLSHSKYGINKEVNINNNSNYLTGYSAVEGTNQSDYPGVRGTTPDVTLPYNTETGYLASTTGNISGLYDMSGGNYEYMASYMDGVYGSSGFTAETISNYNEKYFDIYSSNSTITSYNNRILGDATGEMGPFYSYQDGDTIIRYHNSWYADSSGFVDSSSPWFTRGGIFDNGVLASQFHFVRYDGGSNSALGFRLVLAF